jgi:hypothetical protein
MTTKRDITPEVVLQRLIPALEREPLDLAVARRTLRGLLAQGPIRFADEVLQQFDEWAADALEVGIVYRELLQFLRGAVRLRDLGERGPRPRIEIATVTLSLTLERGRLVPAGEAQTSSIRSAIVLQLWELVRVVGVNHLRKCTATDCARLFVKLYRRKFCSATCERRTNKRALRARARDQRQKRRTRDTLPPHRTPPDRDLPIYLPETKKLITPRLTTRTTKGQR